MTSRRVVLGSLLGFLGLGAAGYSGSYVACSAGRRNVAMLKPLLIGLQGLRTPERVGQAWLSEYTVAQTVDALLADRGLFAATLTPDPVERKARVAARIREDFARGDIVVADRWVVSRTEARLAAIWLTS